MNMLYLISPINAGLPEEGVRSQTRRSEARTEDGCFNQSIYRVKEGKGTKKLDQEGEGRSPETRRAKRRRRSTKERVEDARKGRRGFRLSISLFTKKK